MGPWDTVVEEIEEEVDMFAELGALRPAQSAVANVSASVTQQNTYDPLAAFMDDEDEESLMADSLFAQNDETAVVLENQVPEPSMPLSNEVITELEVFGEKGIACTC